MAETSDSRPAQTGYRRSLRWILAALALGVACGLFFGELCAPLKVAGDAFVGLLQMTVLPFISVSLVASIGRLSLHEAALLARTGVIVLAALWTVAFATVASLTLSFPPLETGSFFSTTLIEDSVDLDIVSLYVPSNPFHSLAENVVPAVVVFFMLAGIATIGLDRKELLIDQLDQLADMLSRVNALVVRLAPLGIFAIGASTAGMMTLEEFGRLQAYLLSSTAGSVLLGLVVLPMLVAACTPYGYRELLSASASVLVTAFVIGSTFVVLPLVIEVGRELTARHAEPERRRIGTARVLVPLAYPFPDSGTIMALLFVPFAGWFFGQSMALGEWPSFIIAGLLGSFGSLVNVIPFLLELQQIPTDIFQLFLASGVYTGRLGDMLAAMHLLVFTLLTGSIVNGVFVLRKAPLLRVTGLGFVAMAVLVIGTRSLLQADFSNAYRKEDVLAEMQLLPSDMQATVVAEAGANPVPLTRGLTRLERIQERRLLRVGYRPDHLPFSYVNGSGDLVGFDIHLMHRLAKDLRVALELIPFTPGTLEGQLAEDHFDLAVGGIEATLARSQDLRLSDGYLTVRMALVVPDHRRRGFHSEEALGDGEGLRLAVEGDSYFAERVLEHFPRAELLELGTARDFFEQFHRRADALVTSAEGGAAWTLVHPQFTVVNPFGDGDRISLVFALPVGDEMFEEFLDNWLAVRTKDGTVERLHEYWVLGRGTDHKEPRWSVLRDVLGWRI